MPKGEIAIRPGCTSIATAEDRAVVRLSGTITTLTLRPRGGIPVLEAELVDGSGASAVIRFIGRRSIPGITPGRTVVVEGRLTVQEGRRIIHNPRYELRCS